jgi:glycosyltransferase involved in cell wall biosynthesis
VGQDYPRNKFELIVVDDGSDDGTADYLAKIKLDLNIRVVSSGNHGRSGARNAGIEASSGDIVIFSDDDRIPSRHYISAHMQRHDDAEKVVVGYRANVFSHQPQTRHDQVVLQYVLGRCDLNVRGGQECLLLDANGHFDERRLEALKYGVDNQFEAFLHYFGDQLTDVWIPWTLFATSNVSAPRHILCSLGGFDTEFKGWGMEDIELGYRIQKAGLPFELAPAAINYHQNHIRNFDSNRTTALPNYQHFCAKHPENTVRIWWLRLFGGLNIYDHNRLVKLLQSMTEDSTSSGVIAREYIRLLDLSTDEIGFDAKFWAERYELPNRARTALLNGDAEAASESAAIFIRRFSSRADEEQSLLSRIPDINEYMTFVYLNGVAYCRFVCGLANLLSDDKGSAVEHFKIVIDLYSYAQYWSNQSGKVRRTADVCRKVLDQGIDVSADLITLL